MQVFNVDIYNPSMQLVHHDTLDISAVVYKQDIISPVTNEVIVRYNSNVKIDDYIHLYTGLGNDDLKYFGVVNAVDKINNETQLKVSYIDFVATLNNNFIFDTYLQNDDRGQSLPLEGALVDYLEQLYVRNRDALQNLDIIKDVYYTSNDTQDWTIGKNEPQEGYRFTIVNMYNDFIIEAFKRYGIKVIATFIPSELKVALFVGKFSNDGDYASTIELDLPNVIDKLVVIRKQNKAQYNKVIVYNKSVQYTQQVDYFLHPNGTFDSNNSDRITPVIFEAKEVTVPSGSTFAIESKKAAAEVFKQVEYDNLIEVEVLNDDTLVKPNHIQIGQVVDIIYKGVAYNSILSAYERGKTTKLTFGCIRLDLSKILKQEGI